MEQHEINTATAAQEVTTTHGTVAQVWLDGFASGLASALAKFSTATVEEADNFAQHTAMHMQDDPTQYGAILGQAIERLNGVDTGPKWVHVAGCPAQGKARAEAEVNGCICERV